MPRLRVALLGEGPAAKQWAAALDGSAALRRDPYGCSDVDAVVIGPDTLDPFARAKEALLDGCHVLYAAPFVLSPWQTGALEGLSARQERLLRFVEPFQYRTGFSFLRRLVRGSEALWQPLYLRILRLARPDGGLRIDQLATEQLAICDALLAGTPSRMTAAAVRQDEVGDVCAVFLVLHYTEGPLVQCTVSLSEAADAQQLVAVTPDRTVIMDELDPAAALRIVAPDGEHEPPEGAQPASGGHAGGGTHLVASERKDSVAEETALFLEAVASDDASVANAPRWARVAGLWWAARQSMSFGEPAEVPLPSQGLETEPPPLRLIEGGGQTGQAAKTRPLLTVIAS